MPKIYKLTETTDQATHYYIIPALNVAIPKTPNSQEVLNTLLNTTHLFDLPTGLVDYPIITRKQLPLFLPISILQVKVTYVKYELRTPKEETTRSAISSHDMQLILGMKRV